jgi:hypothetical protein
MSNIGSKNVYPERVASGALGYPLHFLMTILSDVMTCQSREKVFATLPRLVEYSHETRLFLWQPHNDEFIDLKEAALQRSSTTSARTWGTRDTNAPETSEPLCKKVITASTIILPLLEGQEMLAVLKLERTVSFDATEYKTMLWFTQAVSCHLTTLAEQTKTTTLTNLLPCLLTTQDNPSIADHSLALLLEVLRLEHGALLAQQGGHFHSLARCGQLAEGLFQEGQPIAFWLAESHTNGQPFYSSFNSLLSEEQSLLNGVASFVIYPLGETLPAQFMLVLGSGERRQWLKAEKDLLALACQLLSLALCSTVAR